METPSNDRENPQKSFPPFHSAEFGGLGFSLRNISAFLPSIWEYMRSRREQEKEKSFEEKLFENGPYIFNNKIFDEKRAIRLADIEKKDTSHPQSLPKEELKRRAEQEIAVLKLWLERYSGIIPPGWDEVKEIGLSIIKMHTKMETLSKPLINACLEHPNNLVPLTLARNLTLSTEEIQQVLTRKIDAAIKGEIIASQIRLLKTNKEVAENELKQKEKELKNLAIFYPDNSYRLIEALSGRTLFLQEQLRYILKQKIPLLTQERIVENQITIVINDKEMTQGEKRDIQNFLNQELNDIEKKMS